MRGSCIIVVALVSLVAGGCQDVSRPPGLAGVAGGVPSETQGALSVLMPTAATVFVDGPDWEGWSLGASGQAWAQLSQGIKWMSFVPQSNWGVSPEFPAVRHLNVSFDIFFPPRFPVFGAPSEGLSRLVSLIAFAPDAAPAPMTV